MEYFRYILYSETKDSFYIGSTSDIEKRLERHNNGATPSTKPGSPWKIVYAETFSSKTEAIKRELQLVQSEINKVVNSSYKIFIRQNGIQYRTAR